MFSEGKPRIGVNPTPPPAAPHMLSRLDLNLLRVFLAIWDAGSVSGAGVQLHLSQPAVSNALARLRRHWGDPLFERQGARLVPTPEARRLAPVVRQALHSLARALGEPERFDPATATRRFRLAMTDAGAMVFLPRIAPRLAAAGAGLGLEVVPFAFASLAQALASGAVDAAIGPPAPRDEAGSDAELNAHPLFAEHYVAIVRRNGTLARAANARGQLPLAAWREARVVVVEQGSTHHRVVPAALAARGMAQQVVAEVPHFAAAVPLVQAFDALAFVPSMIAAIYTRRGLATTLRAPIELPVFNICWVTHPRFKRDAGLQWLGELVAGALRASPKAVSTRPDPSAPAGS
jgi:DNA-binding transcriptional LysR family regulator